MNKVQQDYKHIVVAALITDEAGKVLIVRPRRKEGWIFPGGIVERKEAPSDACVREIKAELGISITRAIRLLSVDYRGQSDEYIMFIFDCGAFDQKTITRISLPKEHLMEYRFVLPNEAMKLLRRNSARRLLPTLEAKEKGITHYLEDERIF